MYSVISHSTDYFHVVVNSTKMLIEMGFVSRFYGVHLLKKKPCKHYVLQSFAVRTGLEPVTPCVTGMYSNQLN